MKAILWALVACFATLSVADPSCRQSGVYFPYPEDCNKFLTCHLGKLKELSCPKGTFWNDSIKVCDQKENVECIPRSEPDTTTTELGSTTSTTVAPSTNPAPSGQCPNTYDPNHQVYLPHADCTKYYICSWGGVAIEQSCPPNLHWNQNLSYCDFPVQAGCSSVSPTSQPTSLPVTNTTPASPPAVVTDCPPVYDPNHQVYFPHADCTKYYICTHDGNKLEQNCPVGLHWSQAQSYCDRPELAQCTPLSRANTRNQVDRVSAIEELVSSALAPECPMLEYDEEDQPTFFPYPADCTKFYVCSHGYPYEMSCPSGTFWNSEVHACDAPESSGCVSTNGKTMIRV